MKIHKNKQIFMAIAALGLGLLAGCGQKEEAAPAQKTVHKHEHKPPHHGTPVVLGDEEYHMELVLDAPAGKLQAYIMDGELENFVRIKTDSFEITASLPGQEQLLLFKPIANNATGETAGDTSLFEAHADWLKTTTEFDAAIKAVTVNGKTYQNIHFNFPKGKDTDEKKEK